MIADCIMRVHEMVCRKWFAEDNVNLEEVELPVTLLCVVFLCYGQSAAQKSELVALDNKYFDLGHADAEMPDLFPDKQNKCQIQIHR